MLIFSQKMKAVGTVHDRGGPGNGVKVALARGRRGTPLAVPKERSTTHPHRYSQGREHACSADLYVCGSPGKSRGLKVRATKMPNVEDRGGRTHTKARQAGPRIIKIVETLGPPRCLGAATESLSLPKDVRIRAAVRTGRCGFRRCHRPERYKFAQSCRSLCCYSGRSNSGGWVDW